MKKLFTVIFSLALLTACSNQTGATQTDTQATAQPSPSPTDSPDSSSDSSNNGAFDGYKWIKLDNPCPNGAVRSFAVQSSDDQDYIVCEDGSLWQEQKQ